jgi:hypothetical protein
MKNQEERFEELLSITPQVDDDGFTETLMLRLPPHRNISRMRTTILLVFSFTACSSVAVVPGARHFLAELVSGFASSSLVAALNPLSVAVITGLLIWGGVAAAISDA